jgi:Putative Actinobacterial Holin-X, holin superfamily III
MMSGALASPSGQQTVHGGALLVSTSETLGEAYSLLTRASVAIVQALIAFVGRSFGKILSALFDWAVIAIFGYTSGTEKVFLSALLAAAGAWPVLLLGIIAPKVATFVLAFVPVPSWVPSGAIRWIWVGLALLVPLAVGIALAARQPKNQPQRSWPAGLLRGFPITAGLSASFLTTLFTVPALRVLSTARRHTDVQVPLVTDAASYQLVARRIESLQEAHGHPVRREPAPWWLTVPLRILRAVDHEAFASRIPADLAYFEGSGLVLALYPSGVLIRGRKEALALSQGLLIEGVSDLDVWQTSDPRAQEIERLISRRWQALEGKTSLDPLAETSLKALVRAIVALPVAYDDWQILYRKTLQLGRALEGRPQLLSALAHREPANRIDSARATTRALAGTIASYLVQLAQIELELARTELTTDLRAARRSAQGLGLAAMAAVVGSSLLLVALALGLAAATRGWLAALLLGATMLAGGGVAAYVGWTRRPRSLLTLTRKSLLEHWAWLKALA